MNVLFIPTTLKVGYQKRSDTYTDKLAYVIYYDEKGKLRKETSWQGWRDNKLGDDEFENVPTSGFILNRNGGGTRDYYYWNARAEFVRVWDPRGFEFEISIPNLLFILSHVGCTPGKGLEGEFVYGWNGADLVLLSVTSEDYKKSVEFTTKQSVKIDRKSMVVGGTYTFKKDKNNTPRIYMGKMPYTEYQYGQFKTGVKDIFYNAGYREWDAKTGLADVGACVDSNVADNYADLAVKYANSFHSVALTKVEYTLDNLANRTIKLLKDKWYILKKTGDFKHDVLFKYIDYGWRREIHDAYYLSDTIQMLSGSHLDKLSYLVERNRAANEFYEDNVIVTFDDKQYKFTDVFKNRSELKLRAVLEKYAIQE